MGDAVYAQWSLWRNIKLTRDTAIGIGRQAMRIDLLVFWIVDPNIKLQTGKGRRIVFIIAGVSHPGLKFDRLARPIHRAVGHEQGFGLIIFGIIIIRIPDIGKTQKGQTAGAGGRGCQPGHILSHLRRFDNRQAVWVGFCV